MSDLDATDDGLDRLDLGIEPDRVDLGDVVGPGCICGCGAGTILAEPEPKSEVA